jgi:hypothetical protein
MAATMAHATLAAPVVEDNMEISSPLTRDDDLDIDIDFVPYEQDDYMVEDTKSDAGLDLESTQHIPNPDYNEIMPDEYDEVDTYQDDGMIQDGVSVSDEQLIDAGDADYGNDAATFHVEQSHGFPPSSDFQQDAQQKDITDNLGVDEFATDQVEQTHSPNEKPPQNDSHSPNTDNHEEAFPLNEQSHIAELANDYCGPQSPGFTSEHLYHDEATGEESYHTDQEDPSQAGVAVGDTEESSIVVQQADTLDGAPQHDPVAHATPQSADDQTEPTTIADRSHETVPERTHDVAQSSTAFHSLHPVIVEYEGHEISLFPPREQGSSETFFLHDENLVNVSICDLLRACRDVLGDSIQEKEELELTVSDLDLSLTEVCSYLPEKIRYIF